MRSHISITLAAVVTAQESNNIDDECLPHRSCWSAAEVKYNFDWPSCVTDGDCDEDHYCLEHMWTYNGQTETGKGCWRRNVCTGTGTYQMFEERIQQYMCTEEQFADNLDTQPPQNWNLDPLPEKYWNEYEPACKTDADCPMPENGQVCTKLYWEGTKDGRNYANGEACYNWEHPVCPGDTFAAQNYNYESTGFSYYYQCACTSEASATSLALAAAATITLLLNF